MVGEGWGRESSPLPLERGVLPWGCAHRPPHPVPTGSPAHLSDLLEPVGLHVGEDVALGPGEDLKGHGAVVVLQGRDVVVADGQLRARVDLVPAIGGESTRSLGHPRGRAPPGSPAPAAPLPRRPRGLTALPAGRPRSAPWLQGRCPEGAQPLRLGPCHIVTPCKGQVLGGGRSTRVWPRLRPWAGRGFARGLPCEGREWTCMEPPRQRGSGARTVGACRQTGR